MVLFVRVLVVLEESGYIWVKYQEIEKIAQFLELTYRKGILLQVLFFRKGPKNSVYSYYLGKKRSNFWNYLLRWNNWG